MPMSVAVYNSFKGEKVYPLSATTFEIYTSKPLLTFPLFTTNISAMKIWICPIVINFLESDVMDTLPTHIPDPTHPPSGSPSTDSTDTTLTLPSSAEVLDLPSASAILGQTPASIFTQVSIKGHVLVVICLRSIKLHYQY